MGGVSGLFNIAKLSLQAQRVAMEVVAHNLANINTPGYSRQEPVFQETPPRNGNPGQVGTGVQITEIRRYQDRFVENQILQARAQLGDYQARDRAFQRVEVLFVEEEGNGLNGAFDAFFRSLQDLTLRPDGTAERIQVLRQAERLASVFRQKSAELKGIRSDLNQQVRQVVEEINQRAQRIAELNHLIAQAEIGGQQANDFRDQRDLVLKELAERIPIQYFENDQGQITIFVGRGRVLVEGTTVRSLGLKEDAGNSGYYQVTYDPGDGSALDLGSELSQGTLAGLLQVRDTEIPTILGELDELAYTLVTQFNALHQQGYGLDGSTGVDFFVDLTQQDDAAAQIQVSLTDPQKIAAAGSQEGLPGDNTNARALADLQNQRILDSGTRTLQEFYQRILHEVGSTAQQAQQRYEAWEASLDQLNRMREAVSGVSLDEEMAQLIQYQRAFEASARLIRVADEMLQTILEML